MTIAAIGCSGASTPTSPSAAGTTTALNHEQPAAPDTIPPSAPTNPCHTGTTGLERGIFLRWSPSIDDVDRPDQITYLIWDPASGLGGRPSGRVVGTTQFGPLSGFSATALVVNAMDRAGNQSEFAWPFVPCER